ncbi:hypothetical protein SETIT_8G087700v2 [Setaria italica]|uniref:Uncharacterized protein n=2 Tax=Setaria italica TaxID=4555 RepID=A0A368S5N6_SETIT|nr:uncharacterized protein LOC101762935 [Setaria italica]RCV37746.1 hypothetical protein SETIT_8G087700v2 [Setaria italica]
MLAASFVRRPLSWPRRRSASGHLSCDRSAMGDVDYANVPGGYFMGPPANAAAAEPKPAATTQTPGDYFIGTPENIRQQGMEAEPARPAGELKRSRSFMEWFPCLRG